MQRPRGRKEFARSKEGQEGQWYRQVVNEVEKDRRQILRRKQEPAHIGGCRPR